ncbi:hypothetical protein PS723_06466 [Pseudomonas fluorescens]|uniref:Uncharacterized protein n=1 Tax=Pseudomonas fluorescens TaxID=294 RepID=A0A5E7FZS2_PSEFL|nr:hypothetical protein PS723_06466 [Pseudomonas fluorescens]
MRVWDEVALTRHVLMPVVSGKVLSNASLWRGGLPPLDCAAVVEPVHAVSLTECGSRFWARFAVQRGQAP